MLEIKGIQCKTGKINLSIKDAIIFVNIVVGKIFMELLK
jgi:hypothetical protein